MSDKIRFEFTRGKKTISVEQDGKVKGKFAKKEDTKKLKLLLNAIMGEDKKLNGEKEIELMGKLQTIFSQDNFNTISEGELKLAEEFEKSGKDIETFLNEKLNETTFNENKGLSLDIDESKIVIGTSPNPGQAKVEINTIVQPVKLPTTPKQEVPVQSSNKAFAQTISNLQKKLNKEIITPNFSVEYTVRKNENLYNIAKNSFPKGKKPSVAEIHNRVAEIALVNNIKDINNIQIGQVLKMPVVGGQEKNTIQQQATETVPVTTTETVKQQATETVPVTATETVKQQATKSIPVTKTVAPVVRTPIDQTFVEVDSTYAPKSLRSTEGLTSVPVEEEGRDITKFVNDENNVVFYRESLPDFVVIEADTLEELNEIKLAYETAYNRIAPDYRPNEPEEEKIARQATNLAAVKEMINVTGNNITVIERVGDLLSKKYDAFNRSNEEYKNLVTSLIKTKDPVVLDDLLLNKDGDAASTLHIYENKEAFEALANMYKEVRTKELNGELLTNNEKDLKRILKKGEINEFQYDFAEIDNDSDLSPDLRLNYDGDGNICYLGEYEELPNNLAIAGKKRENVENFTKDFRAAMAIGESEYPALYKKYKDVVNDDSFACSVLAQANNFKAEKDDILDAIKNNGVEFLTYLNASHLSEQDQKEVKKAMADRALELYTQKDKGNVKNMLYLDEVIELINHTDFGPDAGGEEAWAYSMDIMRSYFNDDWSNPVYTGRRMTTEEASNLVKLIAENRSLGDNNSQYVKAILNTLTLEDIGESSMLEGIIDGDEHLLYYDEIQNRLGELVDNIDSVGKAIEFVENINDGDVIPYDKLLEKFPNDDSLKIKLLEYSTEFGFANYCENSNEIFEVMFDANGNLKKDKLTESITVDGLATLLQTKGLDDNKRVVWFDKVLAELVKPENYGTLFSLYMNNLDGVNDQNFVKKIREHIGKIIDTSTSSGDMLNLLKTFNYDFNKVPYERIVTKSVSKSSKVCDKLRERVFIDYLAKIEITIDEYQDLCKKNWLMPCRVAHKDDGFSQQCINYGNDNIVAKLVSLSNSKFALDKCSRKGIELGCLFRDELVGASGYNDLKTILDEDYASQDCVIDIIETFGYPNGQGIIEYMDREWNGPTVVQMEKIPNALLELAEKYELTDDESYKTLKDLISRDGRAQENDIYNNDYSSHLYAKRIDQEMSKLIKKIKDFQNN